MIPQSRNHICFIAGLEYFRSGPYIYCADAIMDPEVLPHGFRSPADIICSVDSWNNSNYGKQYPVYPEGWKEVAA